MGQKSLGLIETVGLLAAIEAADTAVKTANVFLIGYEFSKGSGMTTVKIEGDVDAVSSAVSAAQASASRIGKVVSVKVIPRPALGIDRMIRSKSTKGYVKTNEQEKKPAENGSLQEANQPTEKQVTRQSISATKRKSVKNNQAKSNTTKKNNLQQEPAEKTESAKISSTETKTDKDKK